MQMTHGSCLPFSQINSAWLGPGTLSMYGPNSRDWMASFLSWLPGCLFQQLTQFEIYARGREFEFLFERAMQIDGSVGGRAIHEHQCQNECLGLIERRQHLVLRD